MILLDDVIEILHSSDPNLRTAPYRPSVDRLNSCEAGADTHNYEGLWGVGDMFKQAHVAYVLGRCSIGGLIFK